MSRMRRWTLLVVTVLLAAAWGCGMTGLRRPATNAMAPADSLAAAVRALEVGAYADAMGPLRWTASRCEAGVYGRRALLLLAATALDPRNPDASPDDGAALAAHALVLPELEPDDRTVAEVLYLTAMERGADVPTAPAGAREATDAAAADSAAVGPGAPAVPADTGAVDPAAFTPATRFERCGEVVAEAPSSSAMLPELPGASMATLLRQAQARRDSLSARVTALEAELARIRELLQEAVPVPPDTGSGDGW